jgi:gas vesicle protein
MSDRDDFGAFLIGFVVGGVAGAVAALLLAPQSGEETRTMIKDKSIELRDKAAEQAEVIATKAGKVADDARVRGKEFVDTAKKAVAKKRPAEAAGE